MDRTRHRPYVVGVTGNIACGKSTVLQLLEELGADTIDADHLYHELIEPGRPLNAAIRAHFGTGVITVEGEIDRQALGTIVFSDPDSLAELEAITHPAIMEATRDKIEMSHADVVAIDAVKLVESGMSKECDQVWLVECTPDLQRARLTDRNQLSAAEAERRIMAQPPLGPKRAVADVVIDNSGTLIDTAHQVMKAWADIPILQS